jgi:uncharacterized protein YbaR (Trm112 family)
MKRELMDILVCPICQGDLELSVLEQNEIEIISGSLYCSSCKKYYPIVEAVPNLLPPEDMLNQSNRLVNSQTPKRGC